MKILRWIVLSCLLILAQSAVINAQSIDRITEKLAVLWVSGDRDVVEKSCLMYTHAAKRNGWFDEVVLIVWGSSSKLLADGVILEACIACSNGFGVTGELEALGIDVKGMGVPLTNYLKGGYHVLTY